MMKLPKTFLRGSIPPLITPFRNGKVDYDAYAGLVEFQVKNGSHGILVNGTTSEPASLTVEERNRLVDVAIDAAAGKLPIVAATGSQNLQETSALTEHAEKAGADALLIVTPYYTRPPQRGLVVTHEPLGGERSAGAAAEDRGSSQRSRPRLSGRHSSRRASPSPPGGTVTAGRHSNRRAPLLLVVSNRRAAL